MALIYDFVSGNYWNTLTGQYEAKTVQECSQTGIDPGPRVFKPIDRTETTISWGTCIAGRQRPASTAAHRKHYPVGTGVLDYFPDALREIAYVSKVGNDQHNPGEPLHWAREKSTDEADALIRHFLDRGKLDTDGCRHSAKMAWRALALLQKEIESERGTS